MTATQTSAEGGERADADHFAENVDRQQTRRNRDDDADEDLAHRRRAVGVVQPGEDRRQQAVIAPW